MTIVFCAGGTLGHINPALALIRKLKADYPDHQIIFIASIVDQKRSCFDIIEIDHRYFIDVRGFNFKKPFTWFKTIGKIPYANQAIKKIYRQFKPDWVIGMGGYISGIGVRVAQRLGIKTMIHEQNSVLGLANKMVAKKANYRFASFPLINPKYQFEVIGNPRIDEVRNYPSVIKKNHRKEILFIGGSLGALKINQLAIEFSNSLDTKEYNITIITGQKYYQEVKSQINDVSNRIEIIAFSDDSLKYLSRADYIITRAGATTIFEIIGLAKKAILIPSPNVTSNHQYYNGLYLKEIAGFNVDLIEEAKVKASDLLEIISEKIMVNDDHRYLKQNHQINPTKIIMERLLKDE